MDDSWQDDSRRQASHVARLTPLDARGVRTARVRLAAFMVFEVVACALGHWVLAIALLIPLAAQLSWWSADQRRQVLALKM
jgi:hypothetical protein